ncbi:MAG TPA: 1-phosphofructokinase family hexose kinase [Blastocatellia bacterium]|nr:1-phosphofructokinase family hexose kinase [Blastocatellia bacterium]
MLICVSPNPAIDRRLRLEKLTRGAVNRAGSAEPFPGGKAAHVAMAARALGEEVMWVGLLGGAAGDEFENGLSSLRIPVTVVRTGAGTRINLEIIEPDGTITEILEPGGEVTPDEVERLLSICSDVFAEGGADAQVALSGSLPPGAPEDLYAQLTRIAHSRGCRVLLDTSGEALRKGLEASPDLVKPNRDEAAWLTGQPVCDPLSAAEAVPRLLAAGAGTVAVSLGADGMFWQDDERRDALLARPPSVDARSTVGCGDAMLAGLAVAHRRKLSAEEAARLAVACGTANCMASAPGMIDPREVERLIPHVTIRRLHSGHLAAGERGSDIARTL